MYFNFKMYAANGLYVVQGELSTLISALKRDHNSYQVNNIIILLYGCHYYQIIFLVYCIFKPYECI